MKRHFFFLIAGFLLMSYSLSAQVYDYDGNEYTSLVIGDQEWLVENLKATYYNDGTPIPHVTDGTEWSNLSTPGYCWYNNDDIGYKDTYGALYNWYSIDPASNGGKNVCPTGWHVPNDEEWFTMENSIDQTIITETMDWRGTNGGTLLKSDWGWTSGNGTNDYGFSALPGGSRDYYDGSFASETQFGYWWTATDFETTGTYFRAMGFEYSTIYRNVYAKTYGFSIRCVKDAMAEVTVHFHVTDEASNPIPDATVTLDAISVTTDADGYAEFIKPEGLYYYQVSANGYNNEEGEIEVYPEMGTIEIVLYPLGEEVTDIDGNVYPTVIIGDQEWFAKNLMVTHFRNGDPIPTNLSNAQWSADNSGAFAIQPYTSIDGLYSNEEVQNAYGVVYNWHVINDGRGLCPMGWRVPSNDDWNTLTDYIGGLEVAGGVLKSTATDPEPHPRWNSPNDGATDDYGFAALPGGTRYGSGTFGGVGSAGYWWCSDEYDATSGYSRWLNYSSTSMGTGEGSMKASGFSVRCIKETGYQGNMVNVLRGGPSETMPLAVPVQISGFNATPYFSDLNQWIGSWSAPQAIYDQGEFMDNPYFWSNINENPNAGTTWINGTPGSSYGILVVDMQQVRNLSFVSVFQMFSDGKTTHIALAGHGETGGTPPDANDAGWYSILEMSPLGEGIDNDSFVSSPTLFNVNASTRYLKIMAFNDGTFGTPGYIELKGIKAYESEASEQPPTVITNQATSITSNSAICGGNVTSSGNAEVYSRGIVWNTWTDPTLSNYSAYTVEGSGEGEFQSLLTELQPGTTYYVRAYAINNVGTSYGNQISFTTLEEGSGELIAYYPFNGDTYDYSGNENHPFSNYYLIETEDRFGNPSSAYRFDGVSSYTAGSCSNFPTGERTVSLWFKANSVSNRPVLFGYGGNPCGTSWFQALNHAGEASYTVTSHCWANTLNYAYNELPVNRWTHWVITTNNSGTKMYIDGSLVMYDPLFISNTLVEGRDFSIGVGISPDGVAPYTDGNLGYFDGSLDDIKIFNYSLTESEILDLFHEGGWDGSNIVTDIDGNVYPTVVIGNQEWMAENLRVRRYNDTNDIITGLSNEDWQNTSYGAFTVYPPAGVDGIDSELDMLQAYGGLYNWYAVNDPAGLCPTGWRVPSHYDWQVLNSYLTSQGYGSNQGYALKSCLQVNSPLEGWCNTYSHPRWNEGGLYGVDAFGFSALPAGFRDVDGQYQSLGDYAFWWSSTGDGMNSAWMSEVNSYTNDLLNFNYSAQQGFSVRCVRDAVVNPYYSVTFTVDMSQAQGFDPDNDVVYITGSFNDWYWSVPGDNPESQTMEQIEDSWIWTKTLVLPEGYYEYKYFLNYGWEGGEWSGNPNRAIYVSSEIVINDIWGSLYPNYFAGGTGTGSDPFLVENEEHLYNTRYFPNAHFLQIADVYIGYLPWKTENQSGWEPIGTEYEPFSGSYNGNGHIIEGLNIDQESSYQGLFGFVSNALIHNLNLENVSISAYNSVGAIAGYCGNSVIRNCSVSGNISGNSWVGGIVGRSSGGNSIVRNCSSSANITGYGEYIGGVVGFNEYAAVVKNSFSTGSVSGYYVVGGLVGWSAGGSPITNCFATGDVSGNGEVGGLVGRNDYLLENCYSIGYVSGEYDLGGLIGINYGSVYSSYWNTETSGLEYSAAGEGRTSEEMQFPYSETTYVGWNFSTIWLEDSDYSQNQGYPFLNMELSTPVVTFNIDMTYASNFNPDYDYVYITGTLVNWWNEPGIDPENQQMERVEDSMIWTKTFQLIEGEYQYKYFINSGWDNGDPIDNRFLFVNDDMVINNIWGYIEGSGFFVNLSTNPSGVTAVYGQGVYPAGEEVNISIKAVYGYQFIEWTSDTGDVELLEDPYYPYTSFIMPERNVSFTANLEPLPTYNVSFKVSDSDDNPIEVAEITIRLNETNSKTSTIPKAEFIGLLQASINNTPSSKGVEIESNTNENDTDFDIIQEGTPNVSSIREKQSTEGIEKNCPFNYGIYAGLYEQFINGEYNGVANFEQIEGTPSDYGFTMPWGFNPTLMNGLRISSGDDFSIHIWINSQDKSVYVPRQMIMSQSELGPLWIENSYWGYTNTCDFHTAFHTNLSFPNYGYWIYDNVFEYWPYGLLTTFTDAEGLASLDVTEGEYISFVQKPGYESSLTYLSVSEETELFITLNSLFEGGSGTEENPFLIATANQLNAVRGFLGWDHSDKHFHLVADIDLGVAPWNEDFGWLPIGVFISHNNSNNSLFTGTFDGGGHTISNLTINRPSEIGVGLFSIMSGGTIKNLNIENVNITGNMRVGAVSGIVVDGGMINNCSSTGVLKGQVFIGGITSNLYWGSSISNCWSSAYIESIPGNNQQAGGLVGRLLSGTIENSYAVGNVNGLGLSYGGLVGFASDNSFITNCYAVGNVSGNTYVGGLVGALQTSTVENCYSTGFVMGAIAGGLTAYLYDNTSIASNSYWNVETSGQIFSATGTPKITTEMLVQSTFSGWDFEGIWAIQENQTYPYLMIQEIPSYFNYPGIIPPSYLTAEAGDGLVILSWLAPSSGSPSGYHLYRDGYHIATTANNQLSYVDEGLTNFTNYFYQVKALYESDESSPSNGVSIFPNPGFSGGDGTEGNPFLVSSAEELYTVRQHLGSHFLQVANIDLGVSPWNTGVGWQPIGDLYNRFTGSYNGNSFIISNLTNNRPSENTIGLFGYTHFANLMNIRLENVNINGYSGVGALVGTSRATLIQGCSSSGIIYCEEGFAGGLIASNYENSMITESFSTVNLSGNQSQIGGLVGGNSYSSIIENSYATGSITSNLNAAGFVANNFENSFIINCYSTGSVSGYYNIGGLVAYAQDVETIQNSYWNYETSGISYSSGGTGLSSIEMIQQASFAEWDFENVWSINENASFPYLQWQGAPGDHNLLYQNILLSPGNWQYLHGIKAFIALNNYPSEINTVVVATDSDFSNIVFQTTEPGNIKIFKTGILEAETWHYVKASITIGGIEFWSSVRTFFTGVNNTFIDNRDGKDYEWVQVGTQIWMAENLAYNTGEETLFYPNGQPDAYGAYYNWTTLMNISEQYLAEVYPFNLIETNHQGVCPDGWHIPSVNDYTALRSFLNNDAGKLKSTGTIEGGDGVWPSPNSGASDEYGFSLLPAGYFDNMGNHNTYTAFLPSSYQVSGTSVRGYIVYPDYPEFYTSNLTKTYKTPVRCLKNLNEATFNVTNIYGLQLDSITIAIDETTFAQGQTIIPLVSGSYNFQVSRKGYLPGYGIVSIEDEAVYIDVILAPAEVFTLTVEKVGPGIVTPDVGSYSYYSTQIVSLSASNQPGVLFSHWDVNGEILFENSISISLWENTLAIAYFNFEPVAAVEGSFLSWWQALKIYNLAMTAEVMADHTTCSWGNFQWQFNSIEPPLGDRPPFNNSPTGDANLIVATWEGLYRVVEIADAVISIASDDQYSEGNKDMLLAASHFIKGVSLGQLALTYDQGLEYIDNQPVLVPWQNVLSNAMSNLQLAVTYCSTAFSLSDSTVNGISMTNQYLAGLANSYMARFLAISPRNSTQNEQVDWAEVFSYAQNGITQDFAPLGDGLSWEGGKWWDLNIKYLRQPGWGRVDNRIVNLLDPDYPNRYPVDMNGFATVGAPNPHDTNPSGQAMSLDSRLYTDFQFLSSNDFRPERGGFHFSHYRFSRFDFPQSTNPEYGFFQGESQGPLFELRSYELKLLMAEAYARFDVLESAIEILNDPTLPRKARGNLPDISIDATQAEVLEAIFYERDIELFLQGYLLHFSDMRRRDMLQYGTPLHFPVPFQILNKLNSPVYTHGGVENADGINTSNGGDWIDYGELPEYKAVTFRIVDEKTNAPVTGFTISIDGYSYSVNESIISLSSGTYNYSVSCDEYITQTGTFSVFQGNKTVTIKLTPVPRYYISFFVNDNEQPIVNAEVSLSEVGISSTNAFGYAAFSNLPAGNYFYTISAEDYDVVEGNILIDQNLILPINLMSQNVYYTLTLLAEPEGAGVVAGDGEYLADDQVIITATPNQGFAFVGWFYNGESISSEPVFDFPMPNENLTLTALFEVIPPEYFTLTLLIEPEGAGVVTGDGEYLADDQVIITATPNQGFAFVGWLYNSESISSEPVFEFPMPNENLTLTALFEVIPPEYFTLTLLVEPEGAGVTFGAGDYQAGEDVYIEAFASEGFQFVLWAEGEAIISEEPSFVYLMPEGDISLTAHFEVIQPEFFTLTLIANPSNAGNVWGSGEYSEGEQVTILAEANSGYQFVAWKDEEGFTISTSPLFNYTMPPLDVTLTAYFEEAQGNYFTLTVIVSPEGAGSVTGAGPYQEGAIVELTAFPSEGYDFLYWEAYGMIISYEPFITFPMPNSDVTVTAYFEPGQGFITQVIPLSAGWNIFSSYVIPESLDMLGIVQQLIDIGVLVKVQDQAGFAIEQVGEQWVNDIGTISLAQGYQIKVSQNTMLAIQGIYADGNAPWSYNVGWNIAGYPFHYSQDALATVQPLIAEGILQKVQSQTGAAVELLPGFGWINRIGSFNPGQGYRVRVSSAWSPNAVKSQIANESVFTPSWEGFGINHQNIYIANATLNGEPLTIGSQIAAFDGDICVGIATVSETNINPIRLIASSNDPFTSKIDGFTHGNPIIIKVWDCQSSNFAHEVEIISTTGTAITYEQGGKAIIGLKASVVTTDAAFVSDASRLGSISPNPLTSSTTISFYVGNDDVVKIEVFNLLGQRVTKLIDQPLSRGQHSVEWIPSENNVPPGVYIIKLVTKGANQSQRVIYSH